MNQETEINNILAKAMKMEKFGHNFFSLLEELVDDSESRSLFRRLAAEEENHYRMFRDRLLKNGGGSVDEKDFDPDAIFNQGMAKLIKEGPVFVLYYTMDVKQRVIDFYSSSMNRTLDSGVKEMLSELIGLETRHKKILGENLARIRAATLGGSELISILPV